MQYTIQQIVPSQIVVQFEDGSRSVVAISSAATPEEIDHMVSFHDPEFYPAPETLANPHISVGESRHSQRIIEESVEPEEEVVSADPILQIINPLEDPYLVFGAQQLAREGNTEVLDRMLELITPPDSETLMQRLAVIEENRAQAVLEDEQAQEEAEDIFNLATEELG